LPWPGYDQVLSGSLSNSFAERSPTSCCKASASPFVVPTPPGKRLVRGYTPSPRYSGRVGSHGNGRTPDDLFDGHPDALTLYREVSDAVATIGEADVQVTKSQIAFRRRRGFAYVWRPGQYVKSDVPAVLSIALSHEVCSHRIKSVAHPSANVWMHHIELYTATQIDDEVRGWLAEAYEDAV